MSREKQIDEMAKIVAVQRGYGCNEQDHCDMSCQVFKVGCIPHEDAQILYDAGYRKQEWISVDERLPEHLQKILIYDEFQKMTVATYIVYSKGGGDWSTPVRINGKITHWMPLPEAPKMKGGE